MHGGFPYNATLHDVQFGGKITFTFTFNKSISRNVRWNEFLWHATEMRALQEICKGIIHVFVALYKSPLDILDRGIHGTRRYNYRKNLEGMNPSFNKQRLKYFSSRSQSTLGLDIQVGESALKQALPELPVEFDISMRE